MMGVEFAPAAFSAPARRWKPYTTYKDSGVKWLGEIPVDWEVKKLKYTSHLNYGDSLPAEVREEGDIPVYGSNGIVGFHSNANTLAPVLIIGRKGSFGKVNYSEKPCFSIDTAYFIDSRNTQSNLRWLFYIFQLLNLDSLSQDSAIPGLSRKFVYNQIVPNIALPKQRAIAAFLDRKTAHIDTLISKKERLITLLQEKRAALISHTVTKGLNPDVPMKDSGVEWLGEIPVHWDVQKLRRVVEKFVDYRGATPKKVPKGIPLITAKNIKNGVIDFDLSHEFINKEDYNNWMVRGLPEVGDVLITTEAPLGESAQIVSSNIALAQRIILLKANLSKVTNDYLKYHFISSSGKGELWSRATGSTAIGIKAYRLKEILVTIPHLTEQGFIVDYLDSETTKLDILIPKIQEAIEKLQEYRTALISAAVTGKIDVRNENRN